MIRDGEREPRRIGGMAQAHVTSPLADHFVTQAPKVLTACWPEILGSLELTG